jgi:hypothetical protein
LERLLQRLQPLADRQDAAGRAAAERHPVWITVGAEPGPLGAP